MKKVSLALVTMLLLGMLMVSAQEPQTLTVFAASSLTDAFEEIGTSYSEVYPEVTVIFNFAGSSTLATQINEGSPADVFASANQRQMDVVIDADNANAEDVSIFVQNILTVVVPIDNPANIQTAKDLSNAGVKLVLAGPDVPIRQYTDELFENLVGEYGADFGEAVLANVVSEEENVRQVVAKVALGEADAGVVYRSDITPDIADQVLAIAVPVGTSPIAEYPIVALKNAQDFELASNFVAYVLSDDGQAILQKWGFCPAPQDMVMAEMTAEATPEVTPDMTESVCR